MTTVWARHETSAFVPEDLKLLCYNERSNYRPIATKRSCVRGRLCMVAVPADGLWWVIETSALVVQIGPAYRDEMVARCGDAIRIDPVTGQYTIHRG